MFGTLNPTKDNAKKHWHMNLYNEEVHFACHIYAVYQLGPFTDPELSERREKIKDDNKKIKLMHYLTGVV
jgi:hypothetical protein